MSTFMANPQNIERKWYLVDAEGKTMGRLAADVATLLNGKHKVTYTPHQDCGDFVIVTNVEKMVLTGKKLDQKFYRTHSGFPGGLKEVKYDRLMATKPELALRLAVRGMLPKNSIGRASLNRLKLFRGAEHTHAAQKPEVFTK
ncbi:MAG: 50S ribosomal protein L13 [Clostridia bacterium]|nr:50S ribosomal protein L13 [Clostridia bacterium]